MQRTVFEAIHTVGSGQANLSKTNPSVQNPYLYFDPTFDPEQQTNNFPGDVTMYWSHCEQCSRLVQ